MATKHYILDANAAHYLDPTIRIHSNSSLYRMCPKDTKLDFILVRGNISVDTQYFIRLARRWLSIRPPVKLAPPNVLSFVVVYSLASCSCHFSS